MHRPTLELSMIVKDGAATLGRCLESVAPLVDRIVIGDTGSTDETPAIARRWGAEVVATPWEDDFSAARNRLLDLAECDWILVLDADEMVEQAEARAQLATLIGDTAIDAYGCWRWNYVRQLHSDGIRPQAEPNPGTLPAARAYPGFVRSYHIRLFRHHPGVRFAHCVHEHITESLDSLGLARTTAPLVIHHLGYAEDTAAGFAAKVEMYQRLGLRKVETRPDDFDTLFQLGISELEHTRQPEQALARFTAAAALCPSDGRALLYAGVSLLRLGRLEEAQQSLLRAEALGEAGQLLYDALGDSYLRAGSNAQAREAYSRAHAYGAVSPLTQAKHGTAEVLCGSVEEGLDRIRHAIGRDPLSSILKTLLEVSEQAASGEEADDEHDREHGC